MTEQMAPLWDDSGWTLAEAIAWLEARKADGATCPCCGQFAKVYRRSLPSATARLLIALHRAERQPGRWKTAVDGDRTFTYLPPVLDRLTGLANQGGYMTIGHWWGLLEQQVGERPDGSNRVGWWRLTDLGTGFTEGRSRVPRYAVLYNQALIRLEGEPWSIRDALGTRFNYTDLMEGR